MEEQTLSDWFWPEGDGRRAWAIISPTEPEKPSTDAGSSSLDIPLFRMNSVARVFLVTALSASIAACEEWSWPPYEKSLRSLFAENKRQFEEIRQDMLADNLEVVTLASARGRGYRCVGEGCPRTIDEHDEKMQAKYRNLIGERSILRYTLRDGDFNVRDLPLPPTQGGDFIFSFVWSETEALVPHCDERKARLPTCGACYEDLDSNWRMYWRWFPRDLGPDWDGRVGEALPTSEEINEQYEIALNECLKVGREEMGLDFGVE